MKPKAPPSTELVYAPEDHPLFIAPAQESTPPPPAMSVAEAIQFARDAARDAIEALAEPQNPPEDVLDPVYLRIFDETLDAAEAKAARIRYMRQLWTMLQRQSSGQDARQAASAAFRAAMPPLDSRASCRAYIAVVAAGLNEGWITGPEAKTMIYAAQLALAASQEGR